MDYVSPQEVINARAHNNVLDGHGTVHCGYLEELASKELAKEGRDMQPWIDTNQVVLVGPYDERLPTSSRRVTSRGFYAGPVRFDTVSFFY